MGTCFPRVAQSEGGIGFKSRTVQVRVLLRGPIYFWNVNRASEPGLGANEFVPLRGM
jgi:hypothetical protein